MELHLRATDRRRAAASVGQISSSALRRCLLRQTARVAYRLLRIQYGITVKRGLISARTLLQPHHEDRLGLAAVGSADHRILEHGLRDNMSIRATRAVHASTGKQSMSTNFRLLNIKFATASNMQRSCDLFFSATQVRVTPHPESGCNNLP